MNSDRRRFLTLLSAGGGMTLLAACDGMPASAVAPWAGPQSGMADRRQRALAWALLAPNPHNLQPWIADLREPDVVTLRLDPERLLPATDPFSRQVLIGCGAFLELLRMAAAQEGDQIEIEPFPEGAPIREQLPAALPVARVRWAGGRAHSDPLFAQVTQRRTNRAAYGPRPPDAATLSQLAAAVQTPGIATVFASDAARVNALSDLAAEGYRVEFATPAAFQESARVVRVGAAEIAREPSGIVVHGTAIWWARHLGLMRRDDVFDPASSGTRAVLQRYIDAMAATPVWAWQVSSAQDRVSELAAGRAYLRLALAATAAGLAMHPNSQTLQEFPQMQPLFERVHDLTQVRAPARIQMLARLGYAEPVPPSPRRPLAAIVVG